MTEIQCWVVLWEWPDQDGFIGGSEAVVDGFPIFRKELPSHDDIVAEKLKRFPNTGPGGRYQMQGPFPIPSEENHD